MAYGLAEQYRAAKTEVDQKAAPGKKRIAGEVADKKRSVAPDGTEYKKVRFEGEVKKWGKKQKAEVEFIDFIAANFSGNTVHVYESYKNAKGQYVYRDSSGKIHPAPNGVYIDSTGDIYLDLNAGNHGEGLVMNTFAHELYHHIERESPQKSRKLAEFLVQELGYENVEIAVQRQIDKAKRAGHGIEYLMKENGISRTAAERLLYDRAFSDFVADSLETMFTEGNVVEALQKLKSQDAGLFNMIKSFIDKWVKRIRQFYRSHSTISIEGDVVSHLKKFEQIQQMFAEALVDAGENFQAAEVQKNTTVGGGIQHSLRAFVKDGKIFVEIDQEQDRFDGHPVEEYPRIAKDIINEKFNGKVIGLDNKMFVNGASRDEFANPSKRIPDDLYELKMRTAGELDNLLDAGIPLPNENDGKDGHVHPDAIDFSYFKTLFKIGNRYFEAVINIKNIKRGKLFKDVTKIEDVTQDIMSSYGQSPASQFLRTSSMDRITELEEVVKSKSLEGMDVEVDTKTESVAHAPLYSDRDYTYEALTSKPDMVVTTVGKNVPKNRADVVYYAKRNAASVGKTNKNGSVAVYVDDIGSDVILGTDGLKHGLRRTKDPQNDANYIVTLKAGEIIKNSIKINEVTPKKDNATGSLVLIGAARNSSGDLYIVRSIVNQFKNELDAMDVLYAINAKKEELAALEAPRSVAKPLSVTSSTISIAELLDLVNEYFPDILPEDVLKHYGYDARPEGDLGDDALYSDRDTDSVSNRSLLANAFESAAQTDMEKQKIQEYRDKIDLMNGQEQKLRKLNQQIKELSFAKGKRDTAKIRALRDEATKTANRISIYDKQLLRLESSKPLQYGFKRAKRCWQETKTPPGARKTRLGGVVI